MEQKKSGKRPLALPITLILLVMSLMGNVLLLTKNMEHSRGEAFEEGESIFQGFAQSRIDLINWSQSASEIESLSPSDAAIARLYAKHWAEATDKDGDGLYKLMVYANRLSADVFPDSAAIYSSYQKKLREELLMIASGNGSLHDGELQLLAGLKASIAELSELLETFHYGMEGDRNAYIRLSAGHDWLDIAEELQKTLKGFVERASANG